MFQERKKADENLVKQWNNLSNTKFVVANIDLTWHIKKSSMLVEEGVIFNKLWSFQFKGRYKLG